MKRIILIIFLAVAPVLADSPLTSTHFASIYFDYPIIKQAYDDGELSTEMADFLSDTSNTPGAKAALVNGLGWDFNGKNNSEIYLEYLMEKYMEHREKELLDTLLPDELMSLAYMQALDDYFDVSSSKPIIDKALDHNPNSLTYLVIAALIKGQLSFDKDWCNIWKSFEAVLEKDEKNWDIRPKALYPIIDYLILYKSDCE